MAQPLTLTLNKGNTMNDTIQIVWETLNAALYDMTEGDPADAVKAIEEAIQLLETEGAN